MSRISDQFEAIYAGAGSDFESVPWAQLSANTALLGWLADQPAAGNGRALVVGSGLGDDSEALSELGWTVTAFDVSPTAIARCRERFPDSKVEYVVEDLLDLPVHWAFGFDLVVEIRTLQCLLQDERATATRALAAVVAPGGVLYLRCFRLVAGASAVNGPPWPLAEGELDVLIEDGLTIESLTADLFVGAPGAEPGPTLTGVYRRI